MIDSFIKEHTPVIAYLELTLACNIKCKHCYLEADHQNRNKELSINEIDKLLDEMAELGVIIIVLTGGEIFLRKDLFEIMNKIRAKGFALVLFTNGTLITEDLCKKLYELAPLGIEISLHGSTKEVHEKITGIEGSFDKSLNAIKLIKKNGMRVKLKSNVLKSNFDDIENIIKLAEDMDIDYTFDPFIFPGRDLCQEQTEERIGDKELKSIFINPKIGKKLECTDEFSYLEMPENRLCGAGSNIFNISSNGDVYPCIPLKIKAGNIRENSLVKIWNTSKELNDIRNYKVKHLEKCDTCELIKKCSKCMAMSYNENGNLLGCSDLLKQFAKVKRDIRKEEAFTVANEIEYA